MDWKLIFKLSLFGLAMAVATVFVIPANLEPIFWLVIMILCAFLIARKRATLHFLHGLLLGLANCVWVTSAHVLFFQRYLAGHPQEAIMMKSMPLPDSPRLMMALIGPVVGVVSGIIIGLLAWIVGKFVKAPITASHEAVK